LIGPIGMERNAMADRDSDSTHTAGAAMLPAIAAVILTLVWGAYTVLIVFEIFTSPVPALN
jgi:hypothetical protein